MNPAQIDLYLREWLETRPISRDTGVTLSSDLSKAPIDRADRRRIERAARWVVLERGGEFFGLVGLAPSPADQDDTGCFITLELTAAGGLTVSTWQRSPDGEWTFIDAEPEIFRD